jgi:hypothetical protein
MIFNIERNKSTRLPLLVSYLTYFSILKIEALCSSETSGSLRTTGVTTQKTVLISACHLFPLVLCFVYVYPEDARGLFLRNIGFSPNYMRYNPEDRTHVSLPPFYPSSLFCLRIP